MPSTRNVFEPFLLCLALCLALALDAVPARAGESINRIVLQVNDQILTLHDYQQRKSGEVSTVLANESLSMRERQERLGRLGPQVMQDIFRELLLTSRADQLRIFVSENDVEESVRSLAERQGIKDPKELALALANSNMTLEQLRDKMRRELLLNQVVSREVTSQIDVGEEELRAYYRNNKEQFTTPEKRWLKEVIVLESPERKDAELQQLAARIREELLAGDELESVIAPHEEAGETTGVIDLDWLERDELEPALAEIAFSLEPGAYSEPVESRGGLHILHLAGLEEPAVLPFEEVEGQILNRERSLRFNKALRDYLGRLEREAFIREDLPPDAVGYRSLAADFAAEEEEIQLFREEKLPVAEKEQGE